jgi:hypothetical protein
VVETAAIRLCRDSADFLRGSWSDELGLFPFSSAVANGAYVHDYRQATAIRYTINTLLGLDAWSRATAELPPGEIRAHTERFLNRQYGSIRSYADLGLLLVLLREELERAEARDALARIDRLVGSGEARRLELQSIAWMLWGLCSAAAESRAAERVAHELFELLQRDFVDPRSLLPRHSASRLRRTAVSFGAVVYFLRSVHEYARLTGDARAETQFESGVRRMIGIQGPNGEWPWLTSPRSGRPLEFYPVFAVHQDGMAMLFLLPALEVGLPFARDAIERSVAWVMGRNELGTPMYADDPFRAYRSVERAAALPKLDAGSEQPRAGGAACYLRAVRSAALGRSGKVASTRRVRLNPECRSYHLGWLLYVWSARLPLLEEIMGAPAEPAHVVERSLA